MNDTLQLEMQPPAQRTDTLLLPVRNTELSADSSKVSNRIFGLIEQAIDLYPDWTEQLVDSLERADEDFSELSKRKQRKLMRQFLDEQFYELNNIDTLYIIPQLYDYTFMVQNTNTFENFTLSSAGNRKQELRFAPKPTFRLGGYFGWRWLFLGYTFDIGGLLGHGHNNKKTEIDLSFYTSRLGFDFYYRQTGNDFRCTNLNSLFTASSPRPAGLSDNFNGLSIHTRGFNTYYIFNHHHFSYPAAFSQSTVQRRSCGSFKAGLSITYHEVRLDEAAIDASLKPYLDPTLFFETVKYNDFNINFGYAYNWVFRRDWLACVSFSPALAYNITYLDKLDEDAYKEQPDKPVFLRFSLDKLNFDFIFRLGVVYNNTHYFAGCSFILHSFDYKNTKIRFNNSFGSLNFYAGLNFKKKKTMRN